MPTQAGRDAARKAVMAAMARKGWNPARLATEAGIDYGTAGDFVLGKRWPKVATLGRIDAALGWQPGTLAALGEELGPLPAPTESTEGLRTVPSTELLEELARRLGLNVVIDDGPADAELPTPER